MANEDTVLWKDKKHHLWFPLSFTTYYIEDECLMIRRGLLNTTVEQVLLYRIVDITFQQSLPGKIFGTGNIILKTRVDSSPEVVLQNIKEPMKIRKMISDAVENCRSQRNVVGKEFYGGGPGPGFVDLDGDGIPDIPD